MERGVGKLEKREGDRGRLCEEKETRTEGEEGKLGKRISETMNQISVERNNEGRESWEN